MSEARREICIILVPALTQDCRTSTAKRLCTTAISEDCSAGHLPRGAGAGLEVFLYRSDHTRPTSLTMSETRQACRKEL